MLLVFERRRVPPVNLPVSSGGGNFVLQPLLELLADPLFGGLPFSGRPVAAALFPLRLRRGRRVGELVLEFLPDALFGRLPFGARRFTAALFPVRLRRRHRLSELVVELLAQLVFEGLPFGGGRRASALFTIRTRLGDQVRHVRLHLFLDLRDARFRGALRLEQGLLTRFGNLAFGTVASGRRTAGRARFEVALADRQGTSGVVLAPTDGPFFESATRPTAAPRR